MADPSTPPPRGRGRGGQGAPAPAPAPAPPTEPEPEPMSMADVGESLGSIKLAWRYGTCFGGCVAVMCVFVGSILITNVPARRFVEEALCQLYHGCT